MGSIEWNIQCYVSFPRKMSECPFTSHRILRKDQIIPPKSITVKHCPFGTVVKEILTEAWVTLKQLNNQKSTLKGDSTLSNLQEH